MPNFSRIFLQNHCLYLNSCHQVIRLIRDLRSRHAVWESLNDHVSFLTSCFSQSMNFQQLELLVSNVIDSTPSILNPAEAFKRVFEAISSGYLHSGTIY